MKTNAQIKIGISALIEQKKFPWGIEFLVILIERNEQ